MKAHEKRYLYYLVFLLMAFPVLSAPSPNNFYYITEEDGLSNRMCFSIQQDKRGFMWIATKLGIDRFDGKNIKSYYITDHLQGYEQMGVNYLRYSPDETIWAFSESGLIFRYDEEQDMFEIVYSVRDFFNDHAVILNDVMFINDYALMLGTSRGMIELDTYRQETTLFNETKNLAVNHIIKVNEQYVLSTNNGLYLAERSSQKDIVLSDHYLDAKVVLHSFYEPEHNRLLIGTLSSGLYYIHPDQPGSLRQAPVSVTKPVRSIITYSPEELAVGVDLEGVFILNKHTLEVNHNFQYNDKVHSPIGSNNVRGLFLDKESDLWIATYHEGVSYQSSTKLQFDYYIHHPDNRQTISDNVVNAILEDSDGDLWFGTNNGVSLFDRKNKTWKHYLNNTLPGKQGDVVLALCEDAQGDIWIGGYALGIARIHKKSGTVTKISADQPNSIIATNYIYSIFKDDDVLWFGGIMGNVTSYNVKTRKSDRYNVSKVNCFSKANEKTVLLGLFNGLFLLDKESGDVKGTSIKKPVTTISRAGNGKFWVGVRNYGFYLYDYSSDTYEKFTAEDYHLSSGYIYAIVPDEKANLWISTEDKLNKFSLTSREVEVFDKQDGLLSNQFNARAYFRCRNGNLIFGSSDGAIEFNPAEIEKPRPNHTYETVVYQFDLFNEPQYYTGEDPVLAQSIQDTKEIHLPYNKNFFSFHFTTPNFQTPQKTSYSYYLEGHDLDWSIPSPIHMVSYSKVAPGEYTFRVCAIIDGERQTERVISVEIAEPWWNTVWARIVYLLIFILMLYYIYRQVKMRQEKKVTESKIDFFVNTAHDLLTPLNLIKAPLKDLQKEIAEGQSAQLLQMALNNSERLSVYIGKLLDFQRVSLNASRLVLSRQNLESFVRYRVESFKVVASHKFIDVECHFDPSVQQDVWFDKEKITQIINNILSNAIKYTPYGGKIVVAAMARQDQWELSVKDTGIGISSRDQNMLFKHVFRADNAINSEEIGSGIGLKLVGSLVHIHKGKINLKSKLGKGTEFILSFPLKYERLPDMVMESEPGMEDTPQESLSSEKKPLILIVEDNPEMADYLKMCLEPVYAVKTCQNGKEALELVNLIYPHLILSDYLMPEMNGFELCQRIKNNIKTSHIPFLLLTGVTDEKSILEGIKAKADDYIKKPVEKELLLSKIANVFELQKATQRRSIEELKNNNAVELSNRADNDFLSKLIKLIEANITNPDLDITFICKEMALSRTLLYNKITQLTGNSPTEFVRIIRLKQAAPLLLSGQYSVTDVSFMVGIDNPKYFSKVFKDFYGVSPKDYLAK
ncbi:two-component regulator propeller domain-containing protein [Bacteroides sp. 51]|uniref:hybrid sensor histidine kinase/response regulator transcription factor n=1 Tax=Bacteroides sp. 51 TaxID=2302938 RepID=UPI0013CFC9E5|nr:two-component regulator propeller domain-containing protein [Bacteroides sp. 51]NDV80471.1 response regulator [Bacteroides sp. 51]